MFVEVFWSVQDVSFKRYIGQICSATQPNSSRLEADGSESIVVLVGAVDYIDQAEFAVRFAVRC